MLLSEPRTVAAVGAFFSSRRNQSGLSVSEAEVLYQPQPGGKAISQFLRRFGACVRPHTLSVPDINLGALRAPGCPRCRCGQAVSRSTPCRTSNAAWFGMGFADPWPSQPIPPAYSLDADVKAGPLRGRLRRALTSAQIATAHPTPSANDCPRLL